MGGSGERYRLMVFDRPVGPWRATRQDVYDDAIARRLGSRQPWSTVTYLDISAWIQTRRARPTPASPPEIAPIGLREIADLSGRSAGIELTSIAANDGRSARSAGSWHGRG
ncbi:hypothetical protein [Sphingomonas sp. PR090111-T3T-6A]|uniref:hypothetical protein n=1 Tax=Sphingomonas sp. PR090111-T3T-6A TaxID=685778 RepID=UPI00036EAAB4|nr:hypothetical protein [Sphingomonas sp. PR090111-T3T-6A]